MGFTDYLRYDFVQHALIAGALVGAICGLISPFVITRRAAFAVHGTAELAFTGAAAGLLIADNAVAGALAGGLVVAGVIAVLGRTERQLDTVIGVVLAFGMGVGVLLLSRYHGFAGNAVNILFGQIFGVSWGQIVLMLVVAALVLATLVVIYRPLQFASVDPQVAAARGVPGGLLGLVFLVLLALTVTEAAQIVGTLLVLSLAITPGAAAVRLTARPAAVTALSVAFALLAAVGGLAASLQFGNIKASVWITGISFAIYLLARVFGGRSLTRR
ncbi:MAG: metal ABC transporter permease [Actinomycetia bacterium]|nr:metal ABC transporter permease [Actinomycetes bacterium]